MRDLGRVINRLLMAAGAVVWSALEDFLGALTDAFEDRPVLASVWIVTCIVVIAGICIIAVAQP